MRCFKVKEISQETTYTTLALNITVQSAKSFGSGEINRQNLVVALYGNDEKCMRCKQKR